MASLYSAALASPDKPVIWRKTLRRRASLIKRRWLVTP